jgi:hypothetical protein
MMSLPKVLTTQHAGECAGRVLEPVDDVLAVMDTAVTNPGSDFFDKHVVLVPELHLSWMNPACEGH